MEAMYFSSPKDLQLYVLCVCVYLCLCVVFCRFYVRNKLLLFSEARAQRRKYIDICKG